jgi:hypothetical protein
MKAGNVPSNQIRGIRKVFTQGIVADNQSVQIDLPRGPAIEHAILTVSGSVVVTTPYTAVRDGAAAKYVQRVDHVLNGNITLDSMTGYGFYVFDKYFGHGETPILNPTNFTNATYPFLACIPLSRVLSDMVRPKDAVLKTDANVTTNQLRVQLGALSNMFVGAGVANYSGGVTLNVYVVDYQETPDANGRTPIPLYYWKKTEQLLSTQSTGTSLPFRINTGNRLRGLVLVPQDNVNSEPVAYGTNVTRVRVVRSGDMRIDIDTPMMEVLGAYANPSAGIGAQFPVTTNGIVIDFANSMGLFKVTKYSECWPVPSNSDVQLQLDIATVGSVRMVTVEGVDLQAAG